VCIQTPRFLREFSNNNNRQNKTGGNALSDELLLSRFEIFATGAAKRKLRSALFFETTLRSFI